MAQDKQIKGFLNALLADDLSAADKCLQGIVSSKIAERIQQVNQELGEGVFDRMAAHTAKMRASVNNFGTKAGGLAKATGQALTGNFGKASNTLNKAQTAVNLNPPQKAKLNSITASVENDLEKLFPNDPAIAKVLAALAELGKKAAAKKPVAKPAARPIVKKSAPKPFKK